MQDQKVLVVSAVNLVEGGTLTVLLESLEVAVECLPLNWRIIALVHSESLVKIPRVELLMFPQSKRSWWSRLWLEWFEFSRLSRGLKPDLWLSLHDITPRVHARRQAVYCHNPSPFYQISWREARLEPKFALFNLLYAHLYRIFISRNHTVVVQQEWIRQAFRRLYSHPNVVVAHPTARLGRGGAAYVRRPTIREPLVFLYPALPRVFKNFEVLCEAMKSLPPEVAGLVDLQLTLSGDENVYARDLYRRFAGVLGVRFIGRQSRAQMSARYENCDVVVFSSKLETWGLPITEAQAKGKPLLVADMPYAHEAVGTCEAVTFLPANDAQSWAEVIVSLVAGEYTFGAQSRSKPEEPFASDWTELWRLLTKDL